MMRIPTRFVLILMDAHTQSSNEKFEIMEMGWYSLYTPPRYIQWSVPVFKFIYGCLVH